MALVLLVSGVRAGAIEAILTITCDNTYELYLNGSFVGSQIHDGTWGWDVPDTWSLELTQGENIIAIRGTDYCCGSGMGLIAKVESSYGLLAATDGTWRVMDVEIPGWTTLGFDDSSWSGAFDQGPYNSIPWTIFAPPLTQFAGSGARWIWRGSPPYYPGYGYWNPDGTYTTCFFRRLIAIDIPVAVELGSWAAVKRLYD